MKGRSNVTLSRTNGRLFLNHSSSCTSIVTMFQQLMEIVTDLWRLTNQGDFSKPKLQGFVFRTQDIKRHDINLPDVSDSEFSNLTINN